MTDHRDAALYFEAFAEKEARPVSREILLKTARALRWLTIAEGRRLCGRYQSARRRRRYGEW
jgi:hypothetical protein